MSTKIVYVICIHCKTRVPDERILGYGIIPTHIGMMTLCMRCLKYAIDEHIKRHDIDYEPPEFDKYSEVCN